MTTIVQKFFPVDLRNLFNFGVKSIKLKQKQVLMRREKVEREESIYAYDCKVKL
jgi:hypothetical protein